MDFALTALFIVLMIEQIFNLKESRPFVITAMITIIAGLFLPTRTVVLISLMCSLVAVGFVAEK
jgi:predicted branched-subunit amino acid permease